MSFPSLPATARWSSSRALTLLLISLVLSATAHAIHDTSETEVLIFPRQGQTNSSQTTTATSAPAAPLRPPTNATSDSPVTSTSSTTHVASTPISTDATSSTTTSSHVETSSAVSSSTSESSSTTSSARSSSSTSLPPSVLATTPSLSVTLLPPSTPSTTIVFTGIPSTTPTGALDGQSSPAPTNALATSATSSSFWNNKGGVAATFLILSLVVVGGIAIAVISWLKRLRAKQHRRLEDEIFDRYHEPDMYQPNSPNLVSPSADPFRSHHNTPSPPGSSDSHEIPRFQISTPVQLPEYYTKTPQTAQYLPPSRSQAPKLAIPNPARKSSFRQSSDSFYGAAGQRPDNQF